MVIAVRENTILQVALPTPLRRTFDYLLPPDINLSTVHKGTRVLVPFGKRQLVGVILSISSRSELDFDRLKTAISILDDEPLFPKSILELIDWTRDYYHHPIGDVVSNVLPVLLRQKPKRKTIKDYGHSNKTPKHKSKKSSIRLNADQKSAVFVIAGSFNVFKVFLLNGITGSGKTEVYLQVIKEVIASGKQALVLVPEINLTPQTIARFQERFAVNIVVLHSRLTAKERLLSWLMAKSGSASIVIGTRSAIFTPLKNPGVIVIDEEHDQSFKQQSGLRYSARDLAVVRAKLENVPVILGSATPSLESIHNAKRKRYVEIKLPKRAGGAICPSFYLVDMRSQKLKEGIAEGLVVQIKKHIEDGGQVILFLNRRGFAPILICHRCSWVASCKHCDAKLTLHQKKKHLRCHHCGLVISIPMTCPECDAEKLLMLGVGTERIEKALQELIPDAKITRIDRDTTTQKGALEEKLDGVNSGEYQILVGTQMLAKGHHFPNVTMVAILNVDQSLFSSDFRSTEHLAQLVMQVSGRAGRAERLGKVYLQTHDPQHPLLLDLINNGYDGFVSNCLAERHAAELPPYSYLALFQAEAKKQAKVLEFLEQCNVRVKKKIDNQVKIFGPVPAAMERKAGYFRAQLLLQSSSRERLQNVLSLLVDIAESLKPTSGLRWFLDVDPCDLNS